MRSTHVKLAVLGAVAVAIAIMAAAVTFNLFIGWKIEADAVGDVEFALYLSDEGGSGRSPNSFTVNESYEIDAREHSWHNPEEYTLATWFAQNPTEDVVQRITFDDWTCYAAIASSDTLAARRYAEEGNAGPEYSGGAFETSSHAYTIVYLDISSEQSLVVTVNMSFAIIGVVGAISAALAGFVAGKRIEQAQEAQKRFYENMSHDLKTPLAGIRGYAEGAERGVVDTHDATRAIVRETDRMTDTINQILGLSRLEAGAVQPKMESLEIDDFVQDCLMPLEGAVRSKNLEVGLDLEPGTIQADPGLFDHALSNVLTNAVRHAATCVRVSYDGTCLRVYNDGGAPATDELPYMFDRFRAGEGGSTGVGLAIAKEVAMLHGWSIEAHAERDGIEIVFTF